MNPQSGAHLKVARTIFFCGITLALASLACSAPVLSQDRPSQVPETAETGVAATIQSLVSKSIETAVPLATVPQPETTASAVPLAVETRTPERVIPQTLYFLSKNGQTHSQVWKLSTDGVTLNQVTSEALDVINFDVSPTTGQVAYIINNQIWLSKSDGSDRKKIIEGQPDDSSDAWRFTKLIGSLHWSPDGSTLAYGLNGLNLYSISAGSSDLVLPSLLDSSSGLLIPKAMYSPHSWSPDGNRLLVSIGYYEGGNMGVYTPATRNFTQLKKTDNSMVCCDAAWATDSAALVVAGFTYGGLSSDLWRYDANSGAGTNLIPVEAGDGTYNYVDWPTVLPGGELRYFFSNLPAAPNSPTIPLTMVQSQADGVTGRTALRPETLFPYDVLWAADGSLALIVQPAPGDPTYPPHGPAVVVFADGRPNLAAVSDGNSFHWGP